jgi:hypothetical protein
LTGVVSKTERYLNWLMLFQAYFLKVRFKKM